MTKNQDARSGEGFEGRDSKSTLVSRNINIGGHRTSVRLEPAMWQALQDISRRENCRIHDICTLIAQHKNSATSLTAAIRVFLMCYFWMACDLKAVNQVAPAAPKNSQERFHDFELRLKQILTYPSAAIDVSADYEAEHKAYGLQPSALQNANGFCQNENNQDVKCTEIPLFPSENRSSETAGSGILEKRVMGVMRRRCISDQNGTKIWL